MHTSLNLYKILLSHAYFDPFKKLLIRPHPHVNGGPEEDRTPDPLLAKQVLSQLSYRPEIFLNVAPRVTHRDVTRDNSFVFPNQFFKAKLVGPSEFESLTPALSAQCSNQLSYGPQMYKDQ